MTLQEQEKLYMELYLAYLEGRPVGDGRISFVIPRHLSNEEMSYSRYWFGSFLVTRYQAGQPYTSFLAKINESTELYKALWATPRNSERPTIFDSPSNFVTNTKNDTKMITNYNSPITTGDGNAVNSNGAVIGDSNVVTQQSSDVEVTSKPVTKTKTLIWSIAVTIGTLVLGYGIYLFFQ